MTITFQPYQLAFKKPARTSRAEMKYKYGYFVTLEDNGTKGIGECSYIEGLSIDNLALYENKLATITARANELTSILENELVDFPSIKFGLETALLDLQNGGNKLLFPSEFTAGTAQIPINGLVWMGSADAMRTEIIQKLEDGFSCIKLKVGAIDFKEECKLLELIRNDFPKEKIEIRLDANGAFTKADVVQKLTTLSQYNIHSIEQPIATKQWDTLRALCEANIIPIALDEELIGIHSKKEKQLLLEMIRPPYIILKPSLLGGFEACDEWIELAEAMSIKWWATSALESNIGLNAIAQWVFSKQKNTTQGLGTGGLYTNNIDSPLYIQNGHLGYSTTNHWQLNLDPTACSK